MPHPYKHKILLAAIDKLTVEYDFEIKGNMFYSER